MEKVDVALAIMMLLLACFIYRYNCKAFFPKKNALYSKSSISATSITGILAILGFSFFGSPYRKTKCYFWLIYGKRGCCYGYYDVATRFFLITYNCEVPAFFPKKNALYFLIYWQLALLISVFQQGLYIINILHHFCNIYTGKSGSCYGYYDVVTRLFLIRYDCKVPGFFPQKERTIIFEI